LLSDSLTRLVVNRITISFKKALLFLAISFPQSFATEDFSSLRYVYDRLNETGNYQELDMIADPDDPRDLFGMLQRSKNASK